MEAAWYHRTTIVEEAIRSPGELTGRYPVRAAEADDVERFAARAGDQELAGRHVVDAPKRLPNSFAWRSGLYGHLVSVGIENT